MHKRKVERLVELAPLPSLSREVIIPKDVAHPFRQNGLSTENSTSTLAASLPYPSPQKKVRTITRPLVREPRKRQRATPHSKVATQESAGSSVTYEDTVGDLFGAGADSTEDVFGGAELASVASTLQSSGYGAIQGSEEDMLHYVDAVQSACVGFTLLHRRLFVVEGWDKVKRQGTVSILPWTEKKPTDWHRTNGFISRQVVQPLKKAWFVAVAMATLFAFTSAITWRTAHTTLQRIMTQRMVSQLHH